MDTFLNTHDLAKLNKMNINSLKFIIKNELKAVINSLLTLKKHQDWVVSMFDPARSLILKLDFQKERLGMPVNIFYNANINLI